MEDKRKTFTIDMPRWSRHICVDDFIVAIGKNKSNSIYHVAEVSEPKINEEKRIVRFKIKVFKSDLLTALNRDKDQGLITMKWYARSKKKNK